MWYFIYKVLKVLTIISTRCTGAEAPMGDDIGVHSS